ncbi:TY-Chap2 family putative peptide chaperone [Demequina sediminicola]|uniref:TY-Chap2 family putative peptide chaperone n=1 Tax=Demequina sediminicola TaxID=1095026 RepID=UPI000782B3DB|nr:hypothetical protein [Demequina sediminicola]
MTGPRVFQPADRFIDAQLWWVASELCRRHPRLGLVETVFDEVGTVVEAVGLIGAREARVGFSRVAGIAIKDRQFGVAPPALLEQVNPHAILRQIEQAHGMGAPIDTPPTNGVTIGYRAIAWILGAMVNSRHSWTVRGERRTDPHVLDDLEWMGGAGDWPAMAKLRANWQEAEDDGALYEVELAHAWVILRDLEPVAVVDRYGDLITARGAVDVLGTYRAFGDDLGRAVEAALGMCCGKAVAICGPWS